MNSKPERMIVRESRLKCDFAGSKEASIACDLNENVEKQSSKREELLALLECKSRELLHLRGEEFIRNMEQISKLLFRLDPSTSALMRAIDEKGQDFVTYYIAAFSDTGEVEKSLRIFRTVRSLVRYIVLMDRYYEVGNLKYKQIASELLKATRAESKGHLKYSIPYSFKACWPFWDFEQLMKKRMLRDLAFSMKEIRYHNMFKSSDAPAIYANVLDSELPTYDRNVSLVLHYNQALQDIRDDFDDIEEDLYDKMPNIFLLGTVKNLQFSQLVSDPDHIREIVVRNNVIEEIIALAEDYERSALGIELPPAYAFLKTLTKKYTQDVRDIRHSNERFVIDKNVANSEVSGILCSQ